MNEKQNKCCFKMYVRFSKRANIYSCLIIIVQLIKIQIQMSVEFILEFIGQTYTSLIHEALFPSITITITKTESR